MTKDELAEEICRRMGTVPTTREKRGVIDVLDAAIQIMRGCVADGGKVTLRGFGTFGHSERKDTKAAKFGRGAVETPAHNVPRFKPARIFREMVAGKGGRP